MRRILALGPLLLLSCICGRLAAANSSENRPAEDDVFAAVPMVEAATLHIQTLQEAPASVTVITAADIHKYGYRTLKEALESVRGFYFTNDRMYDYSGVRGLAIPGDYNSRFLVMLNGHPLTENIYNSTNYFGQDFGLDMDLVERIEIIRGPTSALYGSNGMLANINVVTRAPVDHPLVRVSSETGSFGEKKLMVSSSLDLGRGANLLIASSAFNNGGRDLYFPEFDAPSGQDGIAHFIDAQKGYHTFANLAWGRWNFIGYFNSREIRAPATYGIFDSRGNTIRDSRNFAGLNYTRDGVGRGTLRWHLHYDQYRYDDRFAYALDEGGTEDNVTGNWGDWLTSQIIYSFPVNRLGTLTTGVEGTVDVRNHQVNRLTTPEPRTLLNLKTPDRIGAAFAQQEWILGRRWTAYFGLRYDQSRNFGGSVSPRLALVWQPSGRTAYKFVYGRPFRNPSSFERFYDDGGLSYRANPLLARETAQAFEASVERKFGKRLNAIVNAYNYRLSNVIEAAYVDDGIMQYLNAGARRSTGVEFEAGGVALGRLEASGSFAVQKASRGETGARLSNSPGRIAKARIAAPVVRKKLFLSGALQYLSSRTTPAGAPLRPVMLADVTLATHGLSPSYDIVFGVRNAWNWQYHHPVDLAMDRIRANGRTLFVKLTWRSVD